MTQISENYFTLPELRNVKGLNDKKLCKYLFNETKYVLKRSITTAEEIVNFRAQNILKEIHTNLDHHLTAERIVLSKLSINYNQSFCNFLFNKIMQLNLYDEIIKYFQTFHSLEHFDSPVVNKMIDSVSQMSTLSNIGCRLTELSAIIFQCQAEMRSLSIIRSISIRLPKADRSYLVGAFELHQKVHHNYNTLFDMKNQIDSTCNFLIPKPLFFGAALSQLQHLICQVSLISKRT